MKIRYRCVPLIAMLLLASMTCLGGCAITGGERAARSTSPMQTVENNIRQAIAQVDITGESLQELIQPGRAEVQKTYDMYAANVAQMETIAIQLDNHIRKINILGKDYFAEWAKPDQTDTTPPVEEPSEQGRGDLRRLYNRIPQASIGVMSALHAYMSYLMETRIYLSRHLARDGIAANTPVARKGIGSGEELKEALRPLLSAMERVKAGTMEMKMNKE